MRMYSSAEWERAESPGPNLECRMVVDIRTNEHYTNREVYDIVSRHVKSDVKARSFHLCSSHIDAQHPLVRRCLSLGMTSFGSPTLSDQALMTWPSFKMFDCLTIGEDVQLRVLMVSPSWMVRNLGNSVRIAIT